jgi:hypothetical protein
MSYIRQGLLKALVKLPVLLNQLDAYNNLALAKKTVSYFITCVL